MVGGNYIVIPAQAGIQGGGHRACSRPWIPACAGMTGEVWPGGSMPVFLRKQEPSYGRHEDKHQRLLLPQEHDGGGYYIVIPA